MANKKISALTSASTPLAGTEVLPIVQSGATVKVAISDVTAGRTVAMSALQVNTSGSTYSTYATAHALNGYATAVDASNGGRFIGATTSGSELAYLSLGGNYNLGSTGEIALATDTAKKVILGTANVSRLTLETSGDITVNTGNLIQGTAAKGINFTANTPAAGMTSQLLNWYEEGTWTPALQSWTISGTAPTVTGRYTRIGRQVYLYAQIAPAGGTVSYAAAAGTSYINGLPFTPGFNSGAVWTDASNAANTLATNLVNTAGNAYAPTIVATADVIVFACHFSV